jgi:hypothetical protein
VRPSPRNDSRRTGDRYLRGPSTLPNAVGARRLVETDLRDRAVHVGPARRPSPLDAATAEFELHLDANHIALPPAKPAA